MAKTVIIMGTLNTKENEGQYIRKQIERFGHDTVFIDISLRRSQPKLKNGDIPNAAVAEAAGASIEEIEKLERMPAINVVVKGATRIIKDLYKNKKVDGIIGFGGSMGESISALIEKTLPVNIPKALVTTTLKLAADSVGPKNICIFPTLTDMNGKINKINAITLAHAASAIAGMVNSLPEIPEDKKIIAATQYGNTTPHIEVAKEVLESKGYDFISFHAVGTGGETLEELIASGMVVGVLDITTHEVVDWVFGGFSNAGPRRMETAGKLGIPQVICPGCLDMIQFWSLETVPEKFRDRDFYIHNPASTLMRTSKEESIKLGKVFAEKVNKAIGPTVVAIPLKGWSVLDTENKYKTVYYNGSSTGRYWFNLEANMAFIENLEKNIEKKVNIELLKFDLHINDPQFAKITAFILNDMIIGAWEKGKKYN